MSLFICLFCWIAGSDVDGGCIPFVTISTGISHPHVCAFLRLMYIHVSINLSSAGINNSHVWKKCSSCLEIASWLAQLARTHIHLNFWICFSLFPPGISILSKSLLKDGDEEFAWSSLSLHSCFQCVLYSLEIDSGYRLICCLQIILHTRLLPYLFWHQPLLLSENLLANDGQTQKLLQNHNTKWLRKIPILLTLAALTQHLTRPFSKILIRYHQLKFNLHNPLPHVVL